MFVIFYHHLVHPTIPLLLHPEYLANYDIIFTKYETFRKDYEMFAASKVRLRHQPKYPMFLSPLFSLHWWRLVLDEMHLVESRQEAMKQSSFLSRQNCWCVSGTPFNRDLSEVNAAMQLLNEPWFSNQWVWSRLTEVCGMVMIVVIYHFYNQSTFTLCERKPYSLCHFLTSSIDDMYYKKLKTLKTLKKLNKLRLIPRDNFN